MYSKFRGTVTEYKNLHSWVNKNFGRPRKCDDCGTTTAKRYDWATIENRYTKLRSDWRRLCRSCHQKLDAELFVGKRFAGKTHSTVSKQKTSQTMKQYYKDNPDFLDFSRRQLDRARKIRWDKWRAEHGK